MRHILIVTLLLAVVMAADASTKKKGEKGREPKAGVECSEWTYGSCVPASGDCGAGEREATCAEHTKKHKCKVPCNWKKDFGADCKYKFGRWSECDASMDTKSRTGTLKKALFNADCVPVVRVNRPCGPKPKSKAKKGRSKQN